MDNNFIYTYGRQLNKQFQLNKSFCNLKIKNCILNENSYTLDMFMQSQSLTMYTCICMCVCVCVCVCVLVCVFLIETDLRNYFKRKNAHN